MDHRIMIIGSSCSGKTTLGAALGQALAVKHIDLDELNWLPGWREVPRSELRQKIKKEINGLDSWIISGGYSGTWDITMPLASHVIFPDLPLHKLIYGLTRRTLQRVTDKKEICNGNIETWGNIFSKDSLFIWQLQNYQKKKRQYLALKENPYSAETKFLRFSTVGDVQTIVNAL